jgi:hypothetical protein
LHSLSPTPPTTPNQCIQINARKQRTPQAEFSYTRRGRVGDEGEVLRLDGGTSSQDRSKLIAAFNARGGKGKVGVWCLSVCA